MSYNPFALHRLQVSEEKIFEKTSSKSNLNDRDLTAKKAKQREMALERALLAQAKRREEETKMATKGQQGPPSHSAKRAERRTASGKFQVSW